MNIIDAHAHIYPEKIADKATKSIGDFYGIKMNCVGSINELLASGNEIDVQKYLVHSVAIDPNKVSIINNFVANAVQEIDKFVGFMTLHPNQQKEEIEQEIDRAIALGLKGIKMHPDIQQFDINGENALTIYNANNNRLPILLHTGDDRYEFSAPEKLAKVAKMFPKTTFIGAHFGGYSRWHELDCYLGLENVFFDTSSTLFKLDLKIATELINKLGFEKFFFGTDFPIINHKDELQLIDKLDLTTKQKEMILFDNVVNALNIFN